MISVVSEQSINNLSFLFFLNLIKNALRILFHMVGFQPYIRNKSPLWIQIKFHK